MKVLENEIRAVDIKIVAEEAMIDSPAQHQQAARLLHALPFRADDESWVIKITIAHFQTFIVDFARKTVSEAPDADAKADTGIDCELTINASDIIRINAGEIDPRFLMLYRRVEIAGPVKIATALLDRLAGTTPVNFTPPRQALPEPTTDLDLVKDNIRQFGYGFVKDAVPEGQLAALRARLVEQAALERDIGRAWLDSGEGPEPPNQRVWNLINKGAEFRALLDLPLVETILPDFVGDEYRLSMMSANIAGPGGEPQYIHTDQLQIQPMLSVNIGLNVFFMIDEFTEENGGTRLIPFSHRPENGVSPANIYSQAGTIAAVAPAGTAFVFDSRLWHGTGPNLTQTKRHAIAAIFARYWVRPIENWSLQIPPSTYEVMSERQRALCGFRAAYAMGGVEGVQHGKMVRWAPETLIPELRRPRTAAGD